MAPKTEEEKRQAHLQKLEQLRIKDHEILMAKTTSIFHGGGINSKYTGALDLSHESAVTEITKENIDYDYDKKRDALQKTVDKAKTPDARKTGQKELTALKLKHEDDLVHLKNDDGKRKFNALTHAPGPKS